MPRKRSGISQTRGLLYLIGRLLGDLSAVAGGPSKMVRRAGRRAAGKREGDDKMVTLLEPHEVAIARIRGRAWIYIALRRDKKASHFEYKIHEDPNHVPPKNLPLAVRPIWIENAELWARLSEEQRKALLDARDKMAREIEAKENTRNDKS